MNPLAWLIPSRKPETLDELLDRHQAEWNKARAISGLPPIPLAYTGPLRRKWRDHGGEV